MYRPSFLRSSKILFHYSWFYRRSLLAFDLKISKPLIANAPLPTNQSARTETFHDIGERTVAVNYDNRRTLIEGVDRYNGEKILRVRCRRVKEREREKETERERSTRRIKKK